MKRKVILFIAMSLDGYIAKEDGSVDWLEDVEQYESDSTYDTFYQSLSDVIIGRTTYDQVINELSPDVYPYADIHSYIMTHNPRENTEKITFVNDDVTHLVNVLQKEEGKDIWIMGGSSIIEPLIQENLIDEYYIAIIPKLIGKGLPLFLESPVTLNLKLVEYYAKNDILYMRYVPQSNV